MRRQAKRNREIYNCYTKESEESGATYEDVGKRFGLSASRVCRIVKAEERRRAKKEAFLKE